MAEQEKSGFLLACHGMVPILYLACVLCFINENLVSCKYVFAAILL